jgi:DNA-binding PadR family transcriptional regulator
MRTQSGFLINAGPTMLILAILKNQALAGFHIAQELKRLSGGRLEFQQSTLYPLLNKMHKEGLLESVWHQSDNEAHRRIYSLTDKGQAEAERQILAWRDYSATVGQVLDGLAP